VTTVSSAEEIVLMLQSNIASTADLATGALGRLERQILREQNQLGRLEQNLGQAKSKLDQLAEGSADKRAIAAYEKQSALVQKLWKDVDQAKASEDELFAAIRKLGELKGAAESKSVDVAAYRKQEQAVAMLTDRIGAQRDKIGGLREKLAEGRTAADQMSDATKFLGNRLGVTDSAAFKLGSSLKALGPWGAIAAAGVLVTVAALALFVGVITTALSASSQMRGEYLKLQAASVSSAAGQSWLFNATRESTRSANQLTAAVNRVNATSAAGREKLAGWAADLRGARFQGKQLETTLNAMSIAFSGGGAKGEKMAGDVMNWAKQIRFMGGSVDDLAKRVEQKLGRGAAQAAISFDVQLRRLRENMTWIFGGADIDPLLRALNSVLKLFNAGSDSATGMRDAITRLTEGAIGMMLRLGIVVLRAYLAIRQHEFAWNAIKLTVKGVALGLLVIGGVVMAAVVWVGLLVGAFMALIGGAAFAIVYVHKKLFEFAVFLKDKAVNIGTAIVSGIAQGITAGAEWIWNALKGAVGGAIEKVKNFLESHSPSRKLHREVGFTGMALGVAGGMDEGAPHVARAGVRMASAGVEGIQAGLGGMPSLPAFGGQVSRSSSGSIGKQVVFNDCHFYGDLTEETVQAWVSKYIEGESLDGAVPA
jgi:hypothetical protein